MLPFNFVEAGEPYSLWINTNISISPSDQAILETEYKSNPKPSKAARAEIVEKVTLNEKEVQVRYWSLERSRGRRVLTSVPATDYFADMVPK